MINSIQVVHVAVCLRILRAHMYILLIIQVKISVLIKWSYGPPNDVDYLV